MDTDKGKVLIVDDDPDIRNVLGAHLRAKGYRVLAAADGLKALEIIRQEEPFLVLLDLRMPRIGGMDVLRAIRQEGLITTVIVLTAFGSIEATVEAMKEGAADFLAKPVDFEHMEELLTKVLATPSLTIKEVFRRRQEIDALIEKRFTKKITILFSDIVDSTAYFDVHGDIEGKAMLQRSREMSCPLVERHGGRIIKTMGDSIMATFPDPSAAVRASIQMQKALDRHNRGRAKKQEIHIRIGINSGPCLVEEDDIYGDAVNVAARIHYFAKGDEILCSESVYSVVSPVHEFRCEFHLGTMVKGKTEKMSLYKINWQAPLAG